MKARTTDDELRISRALAIEGYAGVEGALAMLMARLLGTTNDLAAIIFFRITNTSARNGIISELLQAKHGDAYDVFWWGQPGTGAQKRIAGLFALVQQLDTRRNEIVHWHPASTVTSLGERWDDLRPPYAWVRAKHLKPIERPDLDEFSAKAGFVQRSIFHFAQFTTKAPDVFLRAYGFDLETWTRTFAQPVLYPPPGGHPLSPKQ